MKVVGLISGGKDSCFNLMHCTLNGHILTAVASLLPKGKVPEANSYMYQSVGLDSVNYIAEALELPFYSREITGTSKRLETHYGTREPGGYQSITPGDETEDLYELLKEVLVHHPDIAAVSVGAIHSDYQRTRVEHVCGRLGLTVLAYLWKRPERELLREIIAGGVEAKVIKLASAGLDRSHLGKVLGRLEPYLKTLNELYGVSVCGEGGEYETYVLDCPIFKKRIEITLETSVCEPHRIAPVCYLQIGKAQLVEKEVSSSLGIKQPPLLDDEGKKALATLHYRQSVGSLDPADKGRHETDTAMDPNVPEIVSRQTADWLAISCASRRNNLLSYKQIVRSTLDRIKNELTRREMKPENIVFVTVLLTNMKEFTDFNNQYKEYFGILPPARACVATLPSSHSFGAPWLQIDVLANDSSAKTVHVQSLSYWAPANIGPYSQGVSIGGQEFISGQIGLIPSSMKMPEIEGPRSRDRALEHVLALRHVRAIAKVLLCYSPQYIFAAICWLSSVGGQAYAQLAWGNHLSERKAVPNLYAVVKGLPRDAEVEWQVYYRSSNELARRQRTAWNSLVGMPSETGPLITTSVIEKDDHYVGFCHSDTALHVIIGVSSLDLSSFAKRIASLLETHCPYFKNKDILFFRIFSTVPISRREFIKALVSSDQWTSTSEPDLPCISVIPVLSLYTSKTASWPLAVHIYGVRNFSTI